MINKFDKFIESTNKLYDFVDKNSEQEINSLIEIEFYLISREYWENFDLIHKELSSVEMEKILHPIYLKINKNKKSKQFWDQLVQKTLIRAKKEKTIN